MKVLKYVANVCFLMCIATSAYAQGQEPQPFKRDLEQVPFIPKGQWIAGASVSYSQANNDDYQFFIIEDINGENYSFKVSPMVMYAFKDDLAVGGRLGYSRQMTKMESGTVKIDSETDYDVDNLYSISHSFNASATFRNYISMGKSKRFGFFNEVQIQYGLGQSKLCDGTGDDLSGTYERSHSFDIGVSPGVVMFLNNYSALEVNVGVLGFSCSHTKSTTDQIYVSNRRSNSANLKLNLMSISFGVAFYL